MTYKLTRVKSRQKTNSDIVYYAVSPFSRKAKANEIKYFKTKKEALDYAEKDDGVLLVQEVRGRIN